MTRTSHAWLCAVAPALLLGACVSPRVPDDPRPSERDCCDVTSLLLFPVNVAPDVAVDTGALALDVMIAPLLGQEPGNLWPIGILISPIAGPLRGVADALHGDPFWDCWAVASYASRASRDRAAPAPAPAPGSTPSAR